MKNKNTNRVEPVHPLLFDDEIDSGPWKVLSRQFLYEFLSPDLTDITHN